nr:hypothetical protein Itr_chr04CG06900 [Ipomoea trifida]
MGDPPQSVSQAGVREVSRSEEVPVSTAATSSKTGCDLPQNPSQAVNQNADGRPLDLVDADFQKVRRWLEILRRYGYRFSEEAITAIRAGKRLPKPSMAFVKPSAVDHRSEGGSSQQLGVVRESVATDGLPVGGVGEKVGGPKPQAGVCLLGLPWACLGCGLKFSRPSSFCKGLVGGGSAFGVMVGRSPKVAALMGRNANRKRRESKPRSQPAAVPSNGGSQPAAVHGGAKVGPFGLNIAAISALKSFIINPRKYINPTETEEGDAATIRCRGFHAAAIVDLLNLPEIPALSLLPCVAETRGGKLLRSCLARRNGPFALSPECFASRREKEIRGRHCRSWLLSLGQERLEFC